MPVSSGFYWTEGRRGVGLVSDAVPTLKGGSTLDVAQHPLYRQPVLRELLTRLPASAQLTLLGLLLSVVIAIPLGIAAALRPGSPIDHACRILAMAGVSLPIFFTGLVLVYVFYYLFGWVPAPLAGSTSIIPRRRTGPASI